jgi:hypothetical protein
MLRRVARVCEVGKELSACWLVFLWVYPHSLLVCLWTAAYRSASFLPVPYPPVACRREYRPHLATLWFCVLNPQELPAAGGTKSREAALSRTSLPSLELVQTMHSEVPALVCVRRTCCERGGSVLRCGMQHALIYSAYITAGACAAESEHEGCALCS